MKEPHNMNIPHVPNIPLEVLEYLEAVYPDRFPSIDTPDRQMWAMAGKVELVAHLRSLFEEQNETILQGN
jgi:hypothetical protein